MKLFVETHGCRANHYDSEEVLELARRGGYEIVSSVVDADVAVVNTCAVTAEAERDGRKSVRRVARMNPRAKTVVMGCSAALPASGKALEGLPGVIRVVPGADLGAMASTLGVAATHGTRRQRTVRAQLRVQDGCDEHCTFCATTIARGANRSRSADAIVEEALALAEDHPEIVITGTHIGTYGADIESTLGALMQRLVRDVPRVRFRLSSIEATEVDAALVELMAADPMRLAPHIHAPLQSGSDSVLKRMGRHWYSAARYAAAVESMAPRLPVFGLGADVIVGFPGETESDFESTLSLVRQLPFTYLHVFPFSPRAGTAALRLRDEVPSAVASQRSAALRALAADKAQAHAASRGGTQADAIVVESGEFVHAMTEDFLNIPIAGPRWSRGERLPVDLESASSGLVGRPSVASIPVQNS